MEFNTHHHVIDKLAFINGLVSGLALYPQVYSVLSTGSTVGISLTTFVVIMVNSVVWLLYAIHRTLISLAIASLLNLFASGFIVLLVVLFRH